MTTEQDLTKIAISMEQAKEAIMLRDALRRLCANADFNLLINKIYLEDEAIRLVKAKAGVARQDEKIQKDLDHRIIAIGQLNQFFLGVEAAGYQAEKSIIADEHERELALGEE